MNTPQLLGTTGRACITLASLAVLTLLHSPLFAQGTPASTTAAPKPAATAATTSGSKGILRGTVVDDAAGKYLEGAEVTIKDTDQHTTTARDGSFAFGDVAPGPHTIVVSYPGLETKSENVSFAPGVSPVVAVRLTSDVLRLEEFKVSGTKEGMAQAISLQKLSVQTKLVAASDQFGEVSEGNVGEYLKFLPGVTVDYNVNDARGISLRGLSTAFTVVAVDGTPMAGTSSMDDTRRFEFEQIAMNNVETTELFKTVTPDIPANSTGGFVNFVTKSAFDSEDLKRFTYNVSFSAPSTNLYWGKEGGVWGHEKEYSIRPSIELNYAQRVSPKFGFNANYRLSEKYDDSPRTTVNWYQTSSPTLPTIFTATPVIASYAVTSEEKLTHREAFATKLDYKITDATKVSVSGQWNWYDLHFTQRGPRFNLGGAGSATVYGGGSVSGDTYTSKPLTGSNDPTIQNILLYRNKYGTTWHTNGTVEHEFSPNSKASLTAYYSRADGQYRDTTKGFISNTSTMPGGAATFGSFSVKGIGNEIPTFALKSTTGADVPLDFVRVLGNYTFSNTGTATNFQSRPFTARDTKKGISGDYTHDFEWSMPVKAELGFASDDVLRYINRQAIVGDIPATTGAALQSLEDPLYVRDVAFGFGPYDAPDPFKVYDAYKSRLGRLITDDVREFHEKNNAVFLRADGQITPDLLLIAGVRWEKREIDAKAQSRANTRSKASKVDLDYSELYPSLSAKYSPHGNRNLVFRGGVSRTVGHPDYVDLLPVITSEATPGAGDGTISVPDPSLKPYFSTNFDLSADYYLKHSGVVSIYGYRKNVKNYFVGHSMTQAEINAVATDYGYNPAEFNSGTVVANGGKSTIDGVELSYSQNFTFLPKPFDGLNLQANFTYVHVDSDDLDTKYSQLRAVSPKTVNVVIGYRYKNFTFTSTTNWVSESEFGGFVATAFVTGVAGNPTTGAPDTRLISYRDEKITTDMKFEYSFNKHLSVYFLVRNVFNSQRIDYYQGYLPQNRSVVLPLNRYEFGEPHLTLGVRGRY